MNFKKIGIALCGLMMISATSCAGTVTRVKYAELPGVVRQFVGKHFAGQKVNKVIKDTDDAVIEYDIYLQNGTKIEVNQNGDWKEISNRTLSVPMTMLPQSVRTYVVTNYPNSKVVNVDKDRKGYEVKLADSTELLFDLQGNFTRID